MPHSCCVPQCKSRGNQSNEKPVSKFVTFHQFTEDKALHKQWIHAIRRDEGRHFKVTHNTTICSRHFVEECFVWTGLTKKRRKIKPECVPTLFPWNDWGKRPPTETARRPLQRPVLQSSLSQSVQPCSSHSANKENEEAGACPATTVNTSQEEKATYLHSIQLEVQLKALQKENELLKERIAFLNNQVVDLKKKSFCLDNFTSSDENMTFYTGLDSERFQILCSLIEAGNQKGDNVEWYRADKKLYKDLGLEDIR